MGSHLTKMFQMFEHIENKYLDQTNVTNIKYYGIIRGPEPSRNVPELIISAQGPRSSSDRRPSPRSTCWVETSYAWWPTVCRGRSMACWSSVAPCHWRHSLTSTGKMERSGCASDPKWSTVIWLVVSNSSFTFTLRYTMTTFLGDGVETTSDVCSPDADHSSTGRWSVMGRQKISGDLFSPGHPGINVSSVKHGGQAIKGIVSTIKRVCWARFTPKEHQFE